MMSIGLLSKISTGTSRKKGRKVMPVRADWLELILSNMSRSTGAYLPTTSSVGAFLQSRERLLHISLR